MVRKKSKQVCKLVSEELDGGCLLLRLVQLCGLYERKTHAWTTLLPIADCVGKQSVLYQSIMVAVEPRTSSLSL